MRDVSITVSLCLLSFVFAGDTYAQMTTLKPASNGCSAKPSVINDHRISPWNVEIAKIDTDEDLTSACFIDKTNLWVAGGTTAYHTRDQGKTWTKTILKIPTGFSVKKILFSGPALGWILAENEAFDPRAREVWLLQTTNGGKTWQLQLRQSGAYESSMSFANQNSGWLFVSTYSHPAFYSFKILKTTDRGRAWTDVSGELRKMLQVDPKVCCPPKMTNIIAESEAAVMISSLGGRIFSTLDSGASWREIRSPCSANGLNPGSIFGRKSDRFLWMAGGATSLEGMWAKIYEQQLDDSWIRHDLPDFFLTDALYTSESQVFAAGSVFGSSNKQEAAVLYSSDKGNTWSVVYRSAHSETVRRLVAGDPDTIWAVGESGLVVRLVSSSNEHLASKK